MIVLLMAVVAIDDAARPLPSGRWEDAVLWLLFGVGVVIGLGLVATWWVLR